MTPADEYATASMAKELASGWVILLKSANDHTMIPAAFEMYGPLIGVTNVAPSGEKAMQWEPLLDPPVSGEPSSLCEICV